MLQQEVVEIIRSIDSGYTEPYQCRLEDGELYAVKGRNATPKGLVAEAVSGMLGRRMALPIPDFCVCQIAADLLDSSTDANVRTSLGDGICFASHWIQPTEIFSLSMAKKVGDEQLAQIYVFDHWIENGDRTLTPKGGNVNLLLSLVDESLVAFDHNLAFSDDHKAADLETHVGRGAWNRMKQVVGFQSDLKRRMSNILPEVISFESELPFEWLEDAPQMMQRIVAGLGRVNTTEFWNELG